MLARPPHGALPAGRARSELLDEVVRVCDRHLDRGATVVVALSGGPDSTALAYLVDEARPDLHAVIGHVRHGLRDDRADAAQAADHAAALGVGYLERSVDVRPSGEGTEAAARRERYAALLAMARQVRADAVLVGHTADDQAETVVMNIARASGLRGVSGMAQARDVDGVVLLRPLLRLRREDVRGYVSGEGLDAVHDPTNDDPGQRRVRAREEVVPALALLSGGPGDPVGALTRLADLARDDAEALDVVADAEAARLIRHWGPVRCLEIAALRRLPVGVATRLLRRLAATGGRLAGADAVATLVGLTPGEAAHVAGGAWATCGGGWLAVKPPGAGGPLEPRSVDVPGVTPLPEIGLVLHADRPWVLPRPSPGSADQPRLPLDDEPPPLADVDAPPVDALVRGPVPPGARSRSAGTWVPLPAVDPLTVRARRPGDRLRLAHGTRKLQDLYTDHGVPRAARDLVPVVVDAGDEPVWVPGVAVRRFDAAAVAHVRLWLAEAGPV